MGTRAIPVASIFAALVLTAACQDNPNPASSTPQPRQPVLVYQEWTRNSIPLILITSIDGNLLKAVVPEIGSPNQGQADSTAVPLFGRESIVGLLGRDGTITVVPPSVGYELHPVVVDDRTIIGRFGSNNVQLVNLPGGKATTLIRFEPNDSASTMEPMGLNGDRTIVRYFVTHGMVNGKRVPSSAIVSISLSDRTTSIRQMQEFPESKFGFGPIAMSPQGRLFAFQGYGLGSQGQTTQLVDLVKNAKVALPDISVAAYRDLGLSFSPDGAALAVHGCRFVAVAATEAQCKLLLFATTDGHLTASMDASSLNPSCGCNLPTLQPVGWFGTHSLAYVSILQWGGVIPHALDVLTGERQDLPTGLGNLVGVLT